MKAARILLPTIAVIAAAILTVVGGWLAVGDTAHAQEPLPAPGNIMASDGDDPGEVVVSWDAAPGASSYTVFWSNFDAARLIIAAGGPWPNSSQSVDVTDSGANAYALTVNGLTPGTEYGFTVRSKSSSGAESDWPDWVTLSPAGDGGSIDAYDVIRMQSAGLAITRHASGLVANGSISTQQLAAAGDAG